MMKTINRNNKKVILKNKVETFDHSSDALGFSFVIVEAFIYEGGKYISSGWIDEELFNWMDDNGDAGFDMPDEKMIHRLEDEALVALSAKVKEFKALLWTRCGVEEEAA